jgi:hypothetical protein
LKLSDSGGILEMPDESFKDRWLGVWPNRVTSEEVECSRVVAGSCSMSDILINQDGWLLLLQE